MANEKVQIEIGVDAGGVHSGVSSAKRSLNDLIGQAQKVGAQGGQGLDKLGESAKRNARDIERETRSLMGRMQRDLAFLNAGGNRQSREYYEAIFKQKNIDPRPFEKYLQQLDEINKRHKAGMVSAGQYANAMRMVPAQITDIVTQLAGGANPGLVLLQQGGQLRDSFGGVGNMMKGLLSVISPVKVGIAAVGAAAAVTAKWMYEGAQQQNAYAKALVLTNNVSGATVESLQKIHKGLNQANQAYAKNHEALLLLANSGQVHASVMQDMAAGIVSYSRASGAEMKSLAQDLTAVSKDPLKGIVELNDKYGILTASTYKQAQALIEQGRKQEAVNLVMREAGQEMKKLGDRAQENLGYFDRMFHSAGQAYGRLKQVIMDWGKEPVGHQRLVEIDTAIALAKREKNYKGGFDPTIDALEKKRQAIAAELREEQQLNALQANRAAANEAGIKALERFSSIKMGLLNDEEKKLKELKDLDEQRLAIRRAGLVVDEKDFAEQRKRIEAKYAPKEAKGRSEKDRGPRFSAPYSGDYRITSGIQAARLHPVLGFKRAHNGVDVAMPTGTILKAMADGIIERIANDAKGYGKYIDIRYKDGSKSRYAHMSRYADGLRVGSTVRGGQEVGRSGNTGLSTGPHAHIEFRNSSGALRDFRHMVGDKIKDGYNEIKNLAAERYQQMQEEMALLGQKTLAEQTAAEIAIGKYGELEQYEKNALINQAKLLDAKRMMLDVEQEIESSDATIRLLKLEYEYAGQSRAAIEELSRARLEDSIAERRRKMAELGGNDEVLAAYDRQAEKLREIFSLKEKIAKKPIEFDWKKGVKGGLDAYLDYHRDINKQIEEVTQNAFQGMEDALVSFVTKGKADFRSLAQSILSDMARLTLRQTVMKPLVGLLTNFIGGLAGGAMSGAGAGSGGNFSNGTLYITPRLHALGGVYNSPSLSAYSGQIVSSPTLFKFAKGGTGLMGEAGPEAILPLKRGPGGYLGVRADTGKGGDVYVTVNVESGQTSAKGGGDKDAWANIAKRIGDMTRATIAEEKRPGGMLA